MKRKLIQFLLLLSFLFSILHATIISIEESCENQYIGTYILDVQEHNDCQDLCKLHHLFHFMGIISDTDILIYVYENQKRFKHTLLPYTQPFKKSNLKPPIC